MQPFLDSTAVIYNPEELRRRADRDGYLFIRGLLPAAVLERPRLEWVRLAREAGWVRADAPEGDAVADISGFCVEPELDYMRVMARVGGLYAFGAIQHHPNLIGLFERLLGDSILPHPRMIGRTIFPQKAEFTTPPHQDWIPIQGAAETYTAWIPLSDMTTEMGGIQLCAGSHRHGVYDFRPALGAGGLEITDPLEGEWVHNTMRQGDVVIFHSMTVHKGLFCTGERLRMSVDARFQRVGDPITPASLEPHARQLTTWDEVYADWPADAQLRYYWRRWDLNIQDYDPTYHEKRDRLGIQMAEAGDPGARSTLQRIVAREPDSAKRVRAEQLLAELDELDRS